jgi:AraC family transcriptional regulator
MVTKAHGRILFWEGASLWVLRAPAGEQYPKTDVHAHHLVQLTLALTEQVEIDGDGERFFGSAFAIAPDAPHAFEGKGLVAHLFVDPDGQPGRALVRRYFAQGRFASIPADDLGGLPAQLRAAFEDPQRYDSDLRALGQALAARLASDSTRVEAHDPRISKVIAWLKGRLDQTVSLNDVASLVRLSPGRTRHLFVAQTGLPFRTFLLWLRLVRAVELFAAGTSLTEAAHSAGFSDSAHLSRTFRRMFGIPAASLRVS